MPVKYSAHTIYKKFSRYAIIYTAATQIFCSNGFSDDSIHVFTKFQTNWFSTNKINSSYRSTDSEKKTDDKKLFPNAQMQIFKRYATPDSYEPAYMGNIVFLKFDKNSQSTSQYFEPKTYLKTLQDLYGIKHWTVRNITLGNKTALAFDAVWKPTLRYLRIMVSEDQSQAIFTLANFRLAYFESANPEVEILQRHLNGVLDIKNKKTDYSLFNRFKYFSLFESASAQTIPNIPSLPAFPAQPQLPANLCGCAPTDAACRLACPINSNLNRLNETVDKQLGAANKTGATAVDGSLGRIDQGFTRADAFLGEYQETNRLIRRGLDQVDALQRPENVALISFTAAAAATAGAMTVGLIVDGISTAAKAVWEGFTHANENQERLKAFKEAREYYEKYKSKSVELEHSIDQMLYYLVQTKNFRKNREQMLSLSALFEAKEKKREELSLLEEKKQNLIGEISANPNDPFLKEKKACVNDISIRQHEYSIYIDVLNKFEKDRQKIPSETQFCREIREKIDGLRTLEYNLTQARSAIIAGLDIALEEAGTVDKKTEENFRKGIEKADQVIAVEKENAKALLKMKVEDPAYLKKREEYLNFCHQRMAPLSVIPVVKGIYLGIDQVFSKKDNSIVTQCKNAWENSAAAQLHRNQVQRALESGRTRIHNAEIAANNLKRMDPYLHVDSDEVSEHRLSMIHLYNDAVTEYACSQKAPSCEDIKINPISTKEFIATPCCNTSWYARYAALKSIRDGQNSELIAGCGL